MNFLYKYLIQEIIMQQKKLMNNSQFPANNSKQPKRIEKQRFFNSSSVKKSNFNECLSNNLLRQREQITSPGQKDTSLEKSKNIKSQDNKDQTTQIYINSLKNSGYTKQSETHRSNNVMTERKDYQKNQNQSFYQKNLSFQQQSLGLKQIQKINRKKRLNNSIQNQCMKNLSSQRKRGQSIERLKEKVSSYLTLMSHFQSKVSDLTSSTTLSKSITQIQQSSKKVCSFATSIKVRKSFTFLESNTKKVIFSDFIILRKIGTGKYGVIYLALHKVSHFLVVLKRMSKKVILQQKIIEKVILQAKIQTSLQHPHTVKLYGIFDDTQFIYFIMEFMEQGSLYSLMTKRNYHKDKVELLPINLISNLMGQVLEGIEYLHKNNIIHRDIKPQNIVMSHGVAKLCDFGCCALKNTPNERRNTSCGTFDYIPPQIIRGQEYEDSVDMWELGITVYELTVGRLPFYHKFRRQTCLAIVNYKNNLKFPDNFPDIIKTFIMCLLQYKPQNRLSSSLMLEHPFIKFHQKKI